MSRVAQGNPASEDEALWLSEAKALARLALPLAFAHLGQTLLGAVDTAVVGRLGELALGATGLGNALFFVVAVLGMGVMLGLDPLVAQAVGAGDDERARRSLTQGIWLSLLVGGPLMAGVIALGSVLERFGIEPASAALVRDYVWARIPGLIPFLAFVALRSYLQATGSTRPVVLAVVLANVANVPLSILFVFGDAALAKIGIGPVGLPAMGVAGAAWASTGCTVIQMLVLVEGVRRGHHRISAADFRIDGALMRRALELGAPIGLQLLAEFGVFTLVNVAMGNLDARSLAAHQVALTLASMTFMVPVGIGAATSVRVGQAVGRRDEAGTRRAGWTGLGLGVGFMLVSATVFLTLPRPLALLMTPDSAVVEASAALLAVAAVFQVSDGAQAVLAGALRGAGDTRFTLVANVAGHYLVGLPLGLMLTFSLAVGATGLWWGLSAGLSAVALALVWRFTRVTRDAVRPV
ncbi:MAG: MATE family efflux transporter [Polyangiaceae bacterium]